MENSTCPEAWLTQSQFSQGWLSQSSSEECLQTCYKLRMSPSASSAAYSWFVLLLLFLSLIIHTAVSNIQKQTEGLCPIQCPIVTHAGEPPVGGRAPQVHSHYTTYMTWEKISQFSISINDSPIHIIDCILHLSHHYASWYTLTSCLRYWKLLLNSESPMPKTLSFLATWQFWVYASASFCTTF